VIVASLRSLPVAPLFNANFVRPSAPVVRPAKHMTIDAFDHGHIFEEGGIVGPRGSPTPTQQDGSIFEEGGIVGPRGSPTPKPGFRS
jgi:hypothetical protein